MQKEQIDIETCKSALQDITARLKSGELGEAEAEAERLALLSRSLPSRWNFSQTFQTTPRMLLVTATAFVLVAGLGAAISSLQGAPGKVNSISGPDDETLSSLTGFVRSMETGQSPSTAAPGEPLPDVNVMIERLAARLESTPNDLQGWQLLGWSYFNTERYEQAAAAFAKALALDPASAELKRSYEEAKAKASGSTSVAATTPPEALSPPGQDAAIRSMVDGLAQRLESSPRDADGWIQLMRSRVVLGENEVAATAFRKAREVFTDDPAASDKILAAATELGLKTD